MIILEDVMSEIELLIEQHPPERGGVLFGPIGKELITHFVFDKDASTTSVTYTPSEGIRTMVPEIEAKTGLEYKGVVHSHPGALDRLSYGDEIAAANALANNPHLAKIFLPVISQPSSPKPKSHEINLGRSKLSAYAALRTTDGSSKKVRIQAESVRTFGLKTDLCAALAEVVGALEFQSEASVLSKPTVLDIQNGIGISYSFNLDELDVIVIGNEGYPTFAPLLLFSLNKGQAQTSSISWKMDGDPIRNLTVGINFLVQQHLPTSGFKPAKSATEPK
ncbi:MAG: Mov34/MPN/PAD-1 family protein [Verrucomicrobiaceae bacterium]